LDGFMDGPKAMNGPIDAQDTAMQKQDLGNTGGTPEPGRLSSPNFGPWQFPSWG